MKLAMQSAIHSDLFVLFCDLVISREGLNNFAVFVELLRKVTMEIRTVDFRVCNQNTVKLFTIFTTHFLFWLRGSNLKL
jgi:hypothetical protein